MLLLFGAIPRPALGTPYPTEIERTSEIYSAMKDTETEMTTRRFAFALRTSKSPRGYEDQNNLSTIPAGSLVLVYRDNPNEWTGPYLFISVSGNRAVVPTDRGRGIFRSTFAKP